MRICDLKSDGPLFSQMFVWLVEIARLSCASVHAVKISAAPCPGIRNPTVVHLSKKRVHFCQHHFSALCLVDLQPACVQTSTSRRIYNPMQTSGTDIRENVKNTHSVTWCKYISNNVCKAVEQTSQMEFGLCGSFSLMHFYVLVLVVQKMDLFSCRFCTRITIVLEMYPLDHCPFAFHW